jgi:glycosyltransferase involved in cell wall biosynthesis
VEEKVSRNNIVIINFSASLIQDDVIIGKNKGIFYYDTQKRSLISYLTLRFPEEYIDIIGLNPEFKFKVRKYKRYRVIQLPNLKLNNVIILGIIFNLLSFLYLLKRKPSILYAYTDGTLHPYVGAALYSKLSQIPFFIDIRNPLHSSYTDSSTPFYKRLGVRITENICTKCSIKIIHISERSKLLIKSNAELYKKSIVVPSCASDVFFINSSIKDKKVEQLIFAVWGGISKIRRLEIVIKGFIKAKELNNRFNAKLYLIGGPDYNLYKELICKLNASDIILKEYMEQKILASFLQQVSVAVIPIPPEKEYYQSSSPLKLAEAVALELPMIASDIEPNRIVAKYNLGILCRHDVDSYAQAFIKFSESSEDELNVFRENCKKIKDLYTPEHVFNNLGKLISIEINQKHK